MIKEKIRIGKRVEQNNGNIFQHVSAKLLNKAVQRSDRSAELGRSQDGSHWIFRFCSKKVQADQEVDIIKR